MIVTETSDLSENELYMNLYIYTLSSKHNTSIKYNVCQVHGTRQKVQGARYILSTRMIQLFKSTLLSKIDIAPNETTRLLICNVFSINLNHLNLFSINIESK